MKSISIAVLFSAGASLFAQPGKPDGPPVITPEPPMLGIHYAKGEAGHTGNAGSSPLLQYNGGSVMHDGAVVQAIFWGASWANSVSDKISAMDTFYSGVGGSSYLRTTTEYTDGTSAVSTVVGYSGHLIDTSNAPSNGSRTSPILAEVCKMIAQPVSNGYYPVYVDTPRGHAGFCAWHSWGSCNGVPVQFAFFFNLDGDPGCDPQDTSGLRSQGAAALGNVSGHELSEAVTDPRGKGWFDSSGAENADKCAWSFGSLTVPLTNSSWKIQGNWSNAAFNTNKGYANRSGQFACLDGGNYK